MDHVVRLTNSQHHLLHGHLFPGDGKEAVALILCGRRQGRARRIMTAREVHLVPYADCVRRPDSVTWPTSALDPLLTAAYDAKQAIIKVHSHPTGLIGFSQTDDRSDRETLGAICEYLDDGHPHGSIVMTPDGRMVGRLVRYGALGPPIDLIQVTGHDIAFYREDPNLRITTSMMRTLQAFGKGTTSLLQSLSVAVVGCSGTGSIVVEQLARLGVRRLVLIDPDHVEEHNLNRILNAGKEDAYLRRPKVEVLARAIARMGFGTEVVPLTMSICDRAAVEAAAECDVLFGCMDGVEGRHMLNRIATYYNLPYFDVGVRLDADQEGGIDGVAGAVHYLQPGQSSLLSRGVYSMSHVEAEELLRTASSEYDRRVSEGYLRGVDEDRPAVISVNMMFAAMVVNEFLARIHPYRNLANSEYAYVGANISDVQFHTEPEVGKCSVLGTRLGRGDVEPLLDRPAMS